MKSYQIILMAMLVSLLSLGVNSCQRETQVDDPNNRDGVVCPKNPRQVPQSFGVTVTAVGFVCVDVDGRTSCNLRRNLDPISATETGCFAFQDGEQESLEISVDGICFLESTVPSANLKEKNPYDLPLILDPAVECWEADNHWFYPVCSQFLPGNDPLVGAVQTCCGACGDPEADCLETCDDTVSECCQACGTSAGCCDACIATNAQCPTECLQTTACCQNCEAMILPPGATLGMLLLGNPESFQACCADYEASNHQPDRACDSGRGIR